MMQTKERSQALSLELPNPSHEQEYIRVMDQWEALGEKIQPPSMRRYSEKLGANISFQRFLEWCEDDRTTASMLANNVPCTLYFLLNEDKEILGGISINHANTPRGHIHAGIAPWHRGKGYGTEICESLLSASQRCGVHVAYLQVIRDNIRAVNLYTKLGYKVIYSYWYRVKKG